jgi:hypothetical protein
VPTECVHLQTLISFFRKEMEAYRLYTVVPALGAACCVRTVADALRRGAQWISSTSCPTGMCVSIRAASRQASLRAPVSRPSVLTACAGPQGDFGPDERECALATLFDVLYTLCGLMAPFTPFLGELDLHQTAGG